MPSIAGVYILYIELLTIITCQNICRNRFFITESLIVTLHAIFALQKY